jgi:hypothetical protein
LLGGGVGRLVVGRQPFVPLGTVELQDRLQRDFADPVLDRELLLDVVLLLVLPRAKLPDQLNVCALLQGGSEGREFSPGDCPMRLDLQTLVVGVGGPPKRPSQGGDGVTCLRGGNRTTHDGIEVLPK